MSSLFMYYTLRIMFDVTDSNSINSGLCVGISQESSVSQHSEEIQYIKDQLANLGQKMNILVAGHLAENADKIDGPVFKKVSCCSQIYSFFVIVAHDVVLFVTRGSTRKNRGIVFPLRKGQIVNLL